MATKYRLLTCIMVVFLSVTGCVQAQESVRPIITTANAAQVKRIAILGGGTVRVGALSPDEQVFAVGGGIGIWLYPLDGTAPRLLEGHNAPVVALAFSPDGNKLVSGSDDGTARLWDIQTGETLAVFEHQKRSEYDFYPSVFSVAFSPDGKRIVSGGREGARLWNTTISTGSTPAKELFMLSGNREDIVSVAFSPDGSLIAGYSYDSNYNSGVFVLWNAADGRFLKTLNVNLESISRVAFSPDGTHLITEIYDYKTEQRSTVLIDWKAGRRLSAVAGRAAIRADGNVVTASSEGVLQLQDWATGQVLEERGHFDGEVRALTFGASGDLWVFGQREGAWQIWNVTLDKHFTLFSGCTTSKQGVAFSPDGQLLVTATYTSICLWDVQSATSLWEFPVDGGLTSVAFSPLGDLIAAGGCAKTEASRCAQGSLWLWDIKTRKLVYQRKNHLSTVNQVAFSPDGTRLVSVSDDQTLRLWNVQSGKITNQWHNPSGRAMRVAFSPDGKFLASGGYAIRDVHLWTVKTGNVVRYRDQPALGVYSMGELINDVDFNPDGTTIAAIDGYTNVYFWDIQSKTFRLVKDHESFFLAYNLNGTLVATSDPVNIALWDVQTGKTFLTLEGHTEYITDLTFSSDGTLLASASNDGSVQLWAVTPDP